MTTKEIRQQVAIGGALLSAAQVGDTTYEIFDSDARIGVKANSELIDEISSMIQGGVHYIGKTTTILVDGATTNPIIIGDEKVTAKQGDMVSAPNQVEGKQDIEFVFNGTNWYEVGAFGSLKALAYKDNASADYTPSGSVGVSATTIGELNVTDVTGSCKEISVGATVAINAYTPEGTISCGAYTPAGTISCGDIVVDDKKITVKEISS